MTDIENTVSDAANVGSNTQEAVNVEKIVDAQNVSDNATDKPVNDTNGSASEKADDAQPTKAEDEPENSNGTETAATLQPETTREPERSAEVNEENKGSTAVKKSACPTNVKFDATLLPESSDPAEIRKQVEFYFSDSNLPYDKFLWSLVTKENKPVPIKLICSFKRMRRFKDHTTVVSALKESEMLEIGNEDESGDENIKRKIALAVVPTVDNNQTEIRQIFDKAQSRSMYAKGFGDETPTTQIDIEKLVEPYGPINCVRLRRTDKKLFKGSVFIEFSTEELQQKFVALDPKPTFEGKQLEWKTKKEYVTQKQEDIKAGRIKPSKSNNRPFNAFTHEKYAAKNGKPGKGGRGERNDNRGGRGGRRGSRGSGRDRGGKKDSRNGRDKHDKATSPPQKLAADSNGVPKLEDTLPESVPKRKAEEIGSETREAKKPKANQE